MNTYQAQHLCNKSFWDTNQSLGDRVEIMIRIQMEAFPDSWGLEDRREMAVKTLGLGE